MTFLPVAQLNALAPLVQISFVPLKTVINPIKNIISTLVQNAPPIVANVRDIVGIGRLTLDGDYFLNARYKFENTLFGILGCTFISLTDFSSIFFCLDRWMILTFAHISALLGQIQYLKPLLDLPFGVLLSCLAGIGYTFIIVDAIYRLATPDQSRLQKRQALLDIANSVAQIALTAAFAAAATQIYVLLPLAACAALFGVISFFHRWHVARNTFWAPAMK